MKRQYLARLIAISTIITGTTGMMGNYAHADTYNSQSYLSVSGNWVASNGLWYFYDYNGNLKTGWLLSNGKWYFLDNSGAMQTGVIQVDGKVYIFNENGEMQVGTSIVDGVMYNCDENGAIIGNNMPTIKRGFSRDGVSTMSYSNNQIIEDEDSTPDNPNIVNRDDSKAKKYTIEFRNEDGDTIKSINVSENEKIELYTPRKDGYTFDDWSTKEDGEGKTYDAGDKITVKDDMVLYANYNDDDTDDDNKFDNDNITKKFVRGIDITSENNADTITIKGGSLQLTAEVEPENATNKSVIWSIVSGSEYGSLSSSGLLTAVKNGEITVKAEAKDGSNVTMQKTIVITGQESENNNTNNSDSGNEDEKSVSFIEITGQPKLEYDDNEKIDLSGLKVKIHYQSGITTEEIPYSDFNKYDIVIKNYENGQELQREYVNRNKRIILECKSKKASTDNLKMKVIEGPKVAENIKSFDKHDMQDVVFEYSDGSVIDAVKKIQLLKDNTPLIQDAYTVDLAAKKITIKKEYLSAFETGSLNLYISLMNTDSQVLLNKLCMINIEDSEIKDAPNNFIKLEKGTKNSYSKITVLDKTSEESNAEAASCSTSDLEYCINANDLSSSELLVTWRDYNGAIDTKVNANDYINIRKKAGRNTKPSKIYSKKITEDYIASISSMNTIKSFKLKDSSGNIFDGVLNGSNITVIADNTASDNGSVDISDLTPIVEYEGTSSEAAKVKLNIKGERILRSSDSSESSVVSYTSPTNYEDSYNMPVICEVFAESGASRTYYITVYEVKMQKVGILPNKTILVDVTKQVEKKDSNGNTVLDANGNPVIEVKKDSNGNDILDSNGHTIPETKVVKESKVINYSEMYPNGGIDLTLGTPGVATIEVRDPLNESQNVELTKIVENTDLGNDISNGNACVGLVFNDVVSDAKSVKCAESLSRLKRTEDSISLESDSQNTRNGKYLKYVEVASRRSTAAGGSTWQYIYKDQGAVSKTYYYEWLDSSNKTIGYSKLKINLKAE